MDYMANNAQERERRSSSPTTSPKTTTGAQIPPKPSTPRSDPNPYPTTFVQADTGNFKQVVQMLTGSATSEAFKQTPHRHSQIPPKKQGFKLYERRNSLNNALIINTLAPAGISPRQPEILSPSLLDFPSLTLGSPVTPLAGGNNYSSASSSSSSSEEEERVIAEKGFYLHRPKSPPPGDAGEPPRLLPLFPLTSPRAGAQ